MSYKKRKIYKCEKIDCPERFGGDCNKETKIAVEKLKYAVEQLHKLGYPI